MEFKMEEITNELLAFFKVLADANRLKIVGLLAQKPYTVEELSAILHLGPSTVSHHLSRLSEVELVSARAEGYYNLYQLDEKKLEEKAQRILSKETLPAVAAEVEPDDYDRKVLSTFLDMEGRLKNIPSQQKKFQVILRHMSKSFQPDVHYTEKQVNEILGRFHMDYASLRRGLIEEMILIREKNGSEYWLNS
jgi:hypothetical protein